MTTKATRLLPPAWCGGLLVLAACARDARVAQTSLTSAQTQTQNDRSALDALGHGADPRPIPDAVITPMRGSVNGEGEAIAQALCERKLACDELGPNRPYASSEDCLGPARRAGQNHLASTGSCPNGVRQGALETCVAALRSEECSTALDVTDVVAACRMDRLCQ